MEKRRDRIQRQINDKLKELGKRAGLEVDVTLNIARHSFSTNLKLKGVPTSHISDLLGHADERTTAHYLKTIPDKEMQNISMSLLDF